MTLTKRLALGVLTCLLVVFIGTYTITMHNSRNYFIEQLHSNAQDTATSLGLSLTHAVKTKDSATILAMVEAVFDRGYFQAIEVRDMDDKMMVSRQARSKNGGVPKWFVSVIHWPEISETALVMNGWQQAGTVKVVSDNYYAYSALWRNAVQMVNWYIAFALIALGLVYWFIRSIMKPLQRVTAQALSISAHEFPIETSIPKTLELKQVTLAMNQMASKLKTLFHEQMQQTETLRAQVYQDALTGLTNRRYFLQQLASLLDNEDEFMPGYVLMVVLDNLDDFNHEHGYQRGDELVLAISKACQDFWQFTTVNTIARLNGSTFALIIHERDERVFNDQCLTFVQILNQILSEVPLCKAYMGAAAYFLHQTTSNLLAMVDMAVKNARESGVFYAQKHHDQYKYPKQLSGDDLISLLKANRLTLYVQSVTDGKTVLHKEVFARLLNQTDEELGAGYFMPLAEKYEIAHLIDRAVLDRVVDCLEKKPEQVAINISKDTVLSKENSFAYLQELKKLPAKFRAMILLELGEGLIVNHFNAVKPFLQTAKKLGVRIGTDRAGVHFAPFNYLSELGIDYVKLHGSLVQDIDDNQSKQFFIHYFNKMAQTMDIQVIATQVEHQAQWLALQHIHIEWGQGRFLSEIEAY